MHIHTARDSVCAGDDVDPEANSRVLEVEDNISVYDLINVVWRSADLPLIRGGQATWCIASNYPLAIVAQQWSLPKLLPPCIFMDKVDAGKLDVRNDGIWFYLSYFAQQDPGSVYNVLSRLKVRA